MKQLSSNLQSAICNLQSLFALTLFVSAALLFLVQPLLGRMILPLLGGTPAVWNTCLVFFQVCLLAGYLYAHGASSRLGARRQATLHLALMVLPILSLPLLTLPVYLARGDTTPEGLALQFVDQLGILNVLQQDPVLAHPIPWLLLLLGVTVGLPFFVVSATAPLLQKWFAATGHPSARDPYFLYGASNLGSLLALLGYPLLVEPNLRVLDQGRLWSLGYGVLVLLIGACVAVVLVKTPRPAARGPATADLPEYLPPGRRLRWIVLAAVPSSLLLGVTTYLSTDVAAIPLLWVIPLGLYLVSFIVVFARSTLVPHALVVQAAPLMILFQTFVFAVDLKRVAWILFVFHLLNFLVVALFCHGDLVRDRPHPRHLTEFYLWISVGGVLGGLFNTLAAPALFTTPLEYPLALVLACFFLPRQAVQRPAPRHRSRQGTKSINWWDLWLPLGLGLSMIVLIFGLEAWGVHHLWLKVTLLFGLPAVICYTFISRPVRFGLGVGALLLTGGLGQNTLHDKHVIHQERSFYGLLSVVEKTVDTNPPVTYRYFVHGTTIHGQQCLERPDEPQAYYHAGGPIGQLFAASSTSRTKKRIAVLGLGVGGLASYGREGQDWTFYEIDPAVERLAGEYFTYLSDCRERGAQVGVILGDGRLALSRAPDHQYDLIFADAFNSDAVPVHLLTREALRIYLVKLSGDGILVFNISNRYLDLEPVLGALADDAGLVCLAQEDRNQDVIESHWLIMARAAEHLGELAQNPKWKKAKAGRDVWTDDFSNLVRTFRW